MTAQAATQAVQANERRRQLGKSAVALLAGFVVGVAITLANGFCAAIGRRFSAFGTADRQQAVAACYCLSNCLPSLLILHHGSARTRSSDGTRSRGGRHWTCDLYSRRCGHME
jgi:hypothetical protein